MRYILLAFTILFLFSCGGRHTIDEDNVCFTKSDCSNNNECRFKTNLNKNYGHCVKTESCKNDNDCYGNLICNNENKCFTVEFSIKSIKLDTANRGIDYSYQIKFDGIKNNNYYFELIDPLPDGLIMNDSGLITGVPSQMGTYSFKVRLYGHSKNDKIYFQREYVENKLSLTVTGDICDPNPCTTLNKTKCIKSTDSENSFICECNDGFLLINDECIADICNYPTNPCIETNKTICIPNVNNSDYSCKCKEGFYLNSTGDCIINHCTEENNPCTEENKNKCINDETLELGYKCECNDGSIEYQGICIEDICANNPCTDSVKNKCVIDLTAENNYKCKCKDKFYEDDDGVCHFDYCDFQKPCDANTESLKTKCVNDESNTNHYTCECDDRYDVDENGDCFFNPCKINHCREPFKSTCVATGEGEQDYECQCDNGYSLNLKNDKCYKIGDLCETAINILPDLDYLGDTTNLHPDYVATCGSYARSNDFVYKLTTTEPKLLTVTLTSLEDDSSYNAVIHIKDGCEQSGNELGCSDHSSDSSDNAELKDIFIEPNTYYIFVDGYGVTNSGHYKLSYTLNTPCYSDTDCNDNTKFCELETHVCKEDKCLNNQLTCNNGTCNRLDATCICNEGFINKNDFTCIPDPCYNANCTENSTCKVSNNLTTYTCECNNNFLRTISGLCLQNPCTPINACTEEHKAKCTYNIQENDINTICSCDDNYLENENGECIPTIADDCPGVTLPFGQLLTGSTITLNNLYQAKTSYGSDSAKGPEAVYNFTLTKRSHVKITMGFTSSDTWDQYLHLRKEDCTSVSAQIAYSDHYSDPEEIEEDLEAGTYYVFADGYGLTNKGPFTILINVEPLCINNDDCQGNYQVCNSNSGKCECEYGYGFGDNLQCYEKCMQVGEEYYCSNSLDKCNINDSLCHKRTECLPTCTENSTCNLDTLNCDCNEGFIENKDGICVTNLCITNSIQCNGSNVYCNGILGLCTCDDGYENYIEGIGCREDTNPCTPGSKCQDPHKSICVPTSEITFSCKCDNGFIENNNGECIDNKCEPNPCGINSTCSLDSRFHSVCSCNVGYQYDNNNICQPILGDTCNTPKIINTNNFTDNINNNSNSQVLSCETGIETKDIVYKFTLDSNATISVNLTTTNFNYIMAITKNCNNNFTELSCGNSINNLNLDSGTYYLYIKSDSNGDFDISFNISEPLYLKNKNFKDAVLNKAYNENITITGGTPPYMIELSPNEVLPNGLSIVQNHIIGTPIEITSSNNTAKILVTDSNNISKEFTINLLVLDNTNLLKPKSGDLLINEIYYKVENDANNDGVIDIINDEFIEIVNNSYKNLTLDGLSIWDSLDYSYRHNFTGSLLSGNAIVIFGGGDLSNLSSDNVIFVDSTSGNLSLKNSTDKIRIVNENNIVLESVTYNNNGIVGSINRNPDLTNSDFSAHTQVSPSNLLYSPGKKANGDSF